jgi:hypothetical protein
MRLDQEVVKLFMDLRDKRVVEGDTTLRIEGNHSSSKP